MIEIKTEIYRNLKIQLKISKDNGCFYANCSELNLGTWNSLVGHGGYSTMSEVLEKMRLLIDQWLNKSVQNIADLAMAINEGLVCEDYDVSVIDTDTLHQILLKCSPEFLQTYIKKP